jgi:hypothetical protein
MRGDDRVITIAIFVFGVVRDVMPSITPDNADLITQAKMEI